jgi:hypothetical protein
VNGANACVHARVHGLHRANKLMQRLALMRVTMITYRGCYGLAC